MKKEMKLRCKVQPLDNTQRYKCTAELFDGTEFTVLAMEHEVLHDDFEAEKSHADGWLMVVQEAQQGNLTSVTLPQPSDQHGRQVSVNKLDLMPRHVDIQAFNPQVKTQTKKAVKKPRKK